ncbi:MAG: hypothetical protein HC887_01705 [Desulfobacteraceae bacterium]|nr:hypothetical protein [Desulfobacteraceae bacterium]
MAKENFEVYKNILLAPGLNSLQPYINKMTLKDRIVTMRQISENPDTPDVEWRYMPDNIWIGRKKR